MVTTSHVSAQASQLSEQAARDQTFHQQDHRGDLQDQQEAREQAPGVGQTSSDRQVAAAATPSSNQHNREQGTAISCGINEGWCVLDYVENDLEMLELHSHKLDASCGFYRPDASCQQVVSSLLTLSSFIKSVGIRLAALHICRLATS